jgi:nucleotide-binding universal stress UspA family protein
MYKHILLPVDGSDFGAGAIPYAMQFAKAVGAHVTAIHVTAPYAMIAVGAVFAFLAEDEYTKRAAENAASVLDRVKRAAVEAGVPTDAKQIDHAHPWEAIIATTKDRGCDLVIMASHGRSGLASLLLGGETKKVLTHSTIPVLVWRG